MKIVNPLGDVKIGRQGEVVYQRKYGEQIRRTVSPKRAIPSQAQIAHRQLYRAALAWRSQLSLANRRYLEGYCIANGIVDSYHIPLPWSRFALKLYLQAVKFALTDISTTPPTEETTKYESYSDTLSGTQTFYGNLWKAQTFTPSIAHKITSVKLYLTRFGSPGILTVSIRATDGEGKPTGPDLCVGTTDGNSIPLRYTFAWREITLGDGYDLEADTKYAIVFRAHLGYAHNYLHTPYQTGNPYPGGNLISSGDGGGTWQAPSTYDTFFEEWSSITIPGLKTGILHARHPALMKIVHKRNGININGYDTLSSLDEQYLTGQVGLDVEAGDTIEATTLPGIKYPYQVR